MAMKIDGIIEKQITAETISTYVSSRQLDACIPESFNLFNNSGAMKNRLKKVTGFANFLVDNDILIFKKMAIATTIYISSAISVTI